jgi:hypothetical protein
MCLNGENFILFISRETSLETRLPKQSGRQVVRHFSNGGRNELGVFLLAVNFFKFV